MILFLTALHYFFLVVEIIVVTLVVTLVTILFYDLWIASRREDKAQRRDHAAKAKEHAREMMRKEKIRREKEQAAHEGFFEESYIPGFDPNGSIYHRPKIVPTAKALAYYKQMEELENTQQFDVVEEIRRDFSNPKD